MKSNLVVAAMALVSGLVALGGSAAASAQEVTCNGSGGSNCSGTIPDFPISTPFSSTMNLNQALTCGGRATFRGIGVRVDLVHDHVGDLTISAAGPGGTAVLLNQPAGSVTGGCAGEDVKAVFGSLGSPANTCSETTIPGVASNVQAFSNVGALQTGNQIGAWTLTVTDNSNGFEGFVNDWALLAQCETPDIAIPAQSPGGLIAMALLLLFAGAWSLSDRKRRA